MASPIKAKYKEGTHFVKTKWGTGESAVDNYECADCQYKTTQPDKMNEHLDGAPDTHRISWPDKDDEGRVIGRRHPALTK